MQLPFFASQTIRALVLEHYGLDANFKLLAGEVDINLLVETVDEKKYLLKISAADAALAELEYQVAILKHLQDAELPWPVPQMMASKAGNILVPAADDNGQKRYLRMQTWVAGDMLATANPRSPELLKDWGRTAAHLNLALASFDHPQAHRTYKWDPSETLASREHAPLFSTEEKAIADYFWDRFERIIQPRLKTLRKGVNYNDAHEMNLLIGGDPEAPVISGVIDFGDVIHTHTVNELAIACAYGCMTLPDPLTAACHLVSGFHEVLPLTEAEVAVLFDMVSARLLITVASAARNQQEEPDNEYLQISARPAWELLKKWHAIAPDLAHYRMRAACGWEPCPKRAIFEQWLRTEPTIEQLIPFRDAKVAALDLSVGSSELGNNANFLSIGPFTRIINRMLEDAGASYGVGGYKEVRPVYTTDAYQVTGNEGAQWRSVHLGLDIWGPAATPVFAPLSGTVYSIADNVGDRDYGPTIILEHKPASDLTFYTLYGHLSRSSLFGLAEGQKIAAGQQIATVGPAPENGNWPPHLHFQIILDMLGEKQDFPGVAYPHEQRTWTSICPDPQLFFPKLPLETPENRQAGEAILALRSRHLGKSLSISYQQPLHMVRGFGAYLYDTTGRRYLDTVNNVAHVGHEHPKVVRAAQRQQALLNTNTRYLHENIVQFAEELLATLPKELSVVHFVNSGSEANELAIRMTRAWSGQRDMIAVEVGYHGNTGACIDVSSYKFDGKGGQGAPPHTHIVPMPDTYRGLYRNQEKAGRQYAAHVQAAIEKIQQQGRNVSGFIAESILSCGGQIVLPEGYLRTAYEMVRASGGLCIADEVQVGFGRVGEHFWGFELQGVVPDIVTMGKPIGNGHPLAAVVTTPAVAEAFANGMEYFNTFGGNPVSCAIGRAVLNVIKEEGLQQNAQSTGAYLRSGLLNLQQQFPLIGDVRGPGLFQGIELVRNGEEREAAAKEADYIANRMRQRGILMSTDGPLHNVLKIKPPMCFSRTNVDFLLENLELVLKESALK